MEISSYPASDAPCPFCGCLLHLNERIELIESNPVTRVSTLLDERVDRFFASQYSAKGTVALVHGHWNRAVRWFSLAVKLAPGNVAYRQSLRKSQQQKQDQNQRGSFLTQFKLRGLLIRIKKAREARNWKLVERLAERGLNINPWDSWFHAELGEAALRQGLLDVAAFAYEKAAGNDGKPNHKPFLIRLAEIHEQRQDDLAAYRVYERIMQLDPEDIVARFRVRVLEQICFPTGVRFNVCLSTSAGPRLQP